MVAALLPLSARRSGRSPNARAPLPSLLLYWRLFALAILAHLANFAIDGRAPGLAQVFELMSLVTCGFGWLLSRQLFREDANRSRWPLVLVGVLFVLCLTAQALPGGQPALVDFAYSVVGLLSSAVLFLTFMEAIDNAARGARERLFRRLFCAAYGALVGVSLLLELDVFRPWLQEGRAVLAGLALVGAGAAVTYRSANGLGARRTVHRPLLGARIRKAMEEDALYLNPDLKVADLARTLNTADYKVTQSITGELGFANFNQMINSYRIAAACDLLRRDTGEARSILDVAMASGFGSLGPFNRAFKAQTGMTPSAYRSQAKAGARLP